MRTNLMRMTLILGTAILLTTACGGGSSNSTSSTASIGPAGGTLTTSSGLRLTVPAGALGSSTELTLREANDLPEGAEAAVEIEPSGTHFAKSAVLTLPGFDDQGGRRAKLSRSGSGRWEALRGSREVESRHEHEAMVDDTGVIALVPSTESCDDGTDDDGDGLADCSDPACSGAANCGGSACVTDDTCPCGSDCVNGACTAGGSLCSTDADCSAGQRCVVGRSHGQACNFSTCSAGDDAAQGGHKAGSSAAAGGGHP